MLYLLNLRGMGTQNLGGARDGLTVLGLTVLGNWPNSLLHIVS